MVSTRGSGKTNIPSLIREHLCVKGPIVFPNDEVALESWQFGLITHFLKEGPELGNQLLKTICDSAYELLQIQPPVNANKMAIVCFGAQRINVGSSWQSGTVIRAVVVLM